MALYHKWDVKNGFAYVLQFFSLISDGIGGVKGILSKEKVITVDLITRESIDTTGCQNNHLFFFSITVSILVASEIIKQK